MSVQETKTNGCTTGFSGRILYFIPGTCVFVGCGADAGVAYSVPDYSTAVATVVASAVVVLSPFMSSCQTKRFRVTTVQLDSAQYSKALRGNPVQGP